MNDATYPRLICFFNGCRFEADSIRSEGKFVEVDIWIHDTPTLLATCSCGWSAMLHLAGAEPFIAKPISAIFKHSAATTFRFEILPVEEAEVEPQRFGIDLDALAEAYNRIAWRSGALGYKRETELDAARHAVTTSPTLQALWASPKRPRFAELVAKIARMVERSTAIHENEIDDLPSGW